MLLMKPLADALGAKRVTTCGRPQIFGFLEKIKADAAQIVAYILLFI